MNATSISCRDTRAWTIFRWVTVGVTAVAVALRTLCLSLYYEADIGYYTQGNPLPSILFAWILLGTIGFAVFAFLQKNDRTPLSPYPSKAIGYVAYLPALAFALFAFLTYSALSTEAEIQRSTLALIGTAALALLYFILFARKIKTPTVLAITGCGGILWCILILGITYFDPYVPMNAPVKLAMHLGAIGGLLLMMTEIRLCCGFPKKRLQIFSHATATLFLLTASLPSLIAELVGTLPARDLSYADYVFLTLGCFGLCRVRCSANATEEEETTCQPTDETVPEEQPNISDETQ